MIATPEHKVQADVGGQEVLVIHRKFVGSRNRLPGASPVMGSPVHTCTKISSILSGFVETVSYTMSYDIETFTSEKDLLD